MTDIQYWDDTLSEEIDAIASIVDNISSMRDVNDKQEAIESCKSRIRAAGGTKRSFKMEIRLVQDVGQRRSYEARLQQLDQQLQTIQADVKAIETELARSTVFEGADTNNLQSSSMNETDAVKAGDGMLREASAIQDKTQDSLINTKKMIAEAKEVGVSTLEELQRQREVLTNIDRETDRLDDNLARAEALLKAFGKRMAGDHLIQCFTLVNVILLVVVILYSIIKGGGIGSSSNTSAGPPNADGTTTTDGTRQLLERPRPTTTGTSDSLSTILYGSTTSNSEEHAFLRGTNNNDMFDNNLFVRRR